ncbi:hypothetical protein BJY21_003110 [Kineosphaera limosa]|uniref:Uncharacterized protein n=1 Tax=Kineosphaera limosa NBRC 100340 TaxID=1184609 RepID=K6WVM1_9MICO|nr:hypothetical protein [Kineosphaera limosa]NYE01926.1 hypothetical protein [Kineosphaera limosa]GAB96152.1 hypothetical protein KILIM_032_00380 [Kineosphaera limosa NBRC 100340]
MTSVVHNDLHLRFDRQPRHLECQRADRRLKRIRRPPVGCLDDAPHPTAKLAGDRVHALEQLRARDQGRRVPVRSQRRVGGGQRLGERQISGAVQHGAQRCRHALATLVLGEAPAPQDRAPGTLGQLAAPRHDDLRHRWLDQHGQPVVLGRAAMRPGGDQQLCLLAVERCTFASPGGEHLRVEGCLIERGRRSHCVAVG